ncbi:hypothetical protein, partial [Tropicimonas sediminicola]|uniref:hypothetical protein n=1 Tax=Tropicimonas sediminicola TaxID=1031541 RepID=UPI001C3C2603
YTRSTFAKATVMPRLADFCSAQWSVFAPPLTLSSLKLRAALPSTGQLNPESELEKQSLSTLS